MDMKYCGGPTMNTLRARATGSASGLWHTYRNWRYAILFYSLLLTLAVGPLRGALGFHANLLELFLAINLLAAVAPIGGRKTRLVLLSILVVALAGRVGTAWLDQATLESMNLALWTVVALLAAASALRFALGARAVDREHLYAGLSAYLLAGIFFGVFYWVLERTWSGSFAIPGDGAQNNFSLPVAIYYSFVTLTTLGYGDIAPRSEVVRGLAIMEAVAGQLYLAVMIARLVSLYASGEGKGNQRDAQDGPGSTP
jgi:voltage-gated potassium channel